MDGEKKFDHDGFNQGDHCTICRPGFIMTDQATCGCGHIGKGFHDLTTRCDHYPKKSDPAAKAREIAWKLAKKIPSPMPMREVIDLLAAALEAERKAGREEGAKTGLALGQKFIDQSGDKIRQAALEECADIADEHNGCVDNECFKRNCPVVIADRIRRLGADK